MLKSLLRRKRSKDLVESVSMDPNVRIDKEKGIVYGVKILGFESFHGYRYSANAMKRAIPMYEGRAVNVDHPQDRSKPGASRSYRDRFGKLQSVEFREGAGLFGNFHYNRGHSITPQFEYDVENSPSNLGLSHNASGNVNAKGDLVESITVVRSVDLVADPATNASLFEDRGRTMALKVKSKKPSRQKLMAQFLEGVAEHDELADLLEAATDTPDSGPAVETPLAATGRMAMAVFMDESMDIAMKRKKINKLLDLIDDQIQDGPEEDAVDGGADDASEIPEDKGEKPVKKAKPAKAKTLAESKGSDVETRLAAMERKEEVRDLCESKSFSPTKAQLNLLTKVDDDDEVLELIESWSGTKPEAGSVGPRAKKPVSKATDKALVEGKIEEADLKALLL